MDTVGGWILCIWVFCITFQQHFEPVDAGYGSVYGPITCLCADRSVHSLDSSARVRKYGCSLYDHCLKCTNNEHQPCSACPLNRYGLMCQFECHCGQQPCDDGVHGDGECHCNSEEDYQKGGRCQLIDKSYIKDQRFGRLPAPQIEVEEGDILVSWKHMLKPHDPVTGYEIEYKFASEGDSSYTRWSQAITTDIANETYYYHSYSENQIGRFKFRVNYFNRAGRTVGLSTDPVKVPSTPDEPSDVEVYSIKGNTVYLRWNPPLENTNMQVGRNIIGYVVQYFTLGKFQGGSPWITYADAKFDDNTITIGDLEYGSFYRFRIAARNRLGIGKWSAEEATLLPSRENMLECYTKADGSDYRGTKSTSKLSRDCQNWTGLEAARNGLTPEAKPGHGLGYHSFCRNPTDRTTAWCFTTDPDVPWDECNIGQPSENCHQMCAPGLRLSDQGECVQDDVTLIHNRVPLTNGEVCTCALQRSSNGEYITPQSFIGWTKACTYAVGREEEFLLENIYNMDVDVCYEECIKSSECDAFTYSTNGFNVFDNETDIRLCTLFSHMDKALKIEKADIWTKYLSQTIPDDEYIISWGCWPAKDPRNPSEQWTEVDLNNNLVFRDSAYKNYSITVEIESIDGETDGIYISLLIIGSLNVTTPIDLLVTEGTQTVIVSNRNVGFITALKLTGQIGIEITVTLVEIELDSVHTSFECNWCRFTSCYKKGTLGGRYYPDTNLVLPTTTTLFADFSGFTCSSLSYSSSFEEAFFGWCPLIPQLISVGLPEILPQHYITHLSNDPLFETPFEAISKREAKLEDDDRGIEFSQDELTWQESVDSCLRKGKVLAKVLDDDSHSYVTNKIVEARMVGTDFWINGRDTGRSIWKTSDNVRLPSTQMWADGEPNYSGRCLQFWIRGDDGYKFDDTICSIRKRYICQSQFTARTLDCKYDNDRFANTECVAMLNFNMEDLRNEFLEDKSVVVETATLYLNFKGERHIRYFSLEGISDPWTRISQTNSSIPRSILIDTIDTKDTHDLALAITSEPLRNYIEERLNGRSIAGLHGIIVRALQGYQQAGFDDLIVYKDSSLRPSVTLSIHLYRWLVGPWGACYQKDCLGGMQTRSVSCIHAVTNVESDEKYCRFHLRPYTEQSCLGHYDESCYSWDFHPKSGSICEGANGCGLGQLDTDIVCQNVATKEDVPDFYCSTNKPRPDDGPTYRCSEFFGCTYQWQETGDWTECSDNCGGGYRTREISCRSSNGSYVIDSLCPSDETPVFEEKCQDYSDCSVWQSLQLLRQDQIFSDRTLIQTQINLTVPAAQAESSLMDAKANIVERELMLKLLSHRANMSVAEEVATADKLEAQARQAVAKQRIQVPTDSATSFPNVGYLGRGYDIFYGNPRNDDGSIDPGFRQAVIGLTYNKVKYSSDRMYLVPDQADLIREMGSYFGAHTSIITSERSYRNSLSLDVSVGGSVTYGIGSGSFSASASYKTMNQATMNSNSVFVDIVGRVVVYDARLVPFSMDASAEFREAVKHLPPLRCCIYSVTCNVGCSLYDEFISAFGTHYTTNVLMGGRAVQRYQMNSQSMEKIQEREVGAGFSASGGVSGIASFSTSMSMKMTNSMKNSLSTSETSSTEFFLGGEAGIGDISEGSTDSMKEWASTVFDNPVPIKYQLGAVIDLLDQDNFPEDRRIGIKEEVLRSKYLSYCDRIPDARCSDFSKRDDSEDPSNYVHFGDAVHIKTGTVNNAQMMLREESDGDKKYVFASAKGFVDTSPNSKITIVPLPNKVCTWVLQGPKNPHGKDWIKFMKEVHDRIPSKSVTYTGLSKDDCEDHCKKMKNMKCFAGTFTEKSSGFCMLFTSKEHASVRYVSRKTKGTWFWKKTTITNYDYHWSCYTELDKERFGNSWNDLSLSSFKSKSRFITSEQTKVFSILSPLSINNIQREQLNFGDPFILTSASGVVTRDEGSDNYYINVEVGASPYDREYMRFRFVNDHKPNGMGVKFEDDVMLQEAGDPEYRTTEKLFMQNLPYYIILPSGGYKTRCSNSWWQFGGGVCTREANVKVSKRVYDTDSESAYVWNLAVADIDGIVPQLAVKRFSALERAQFEVEEGGKSVIVSVVFTRPVRRKDPVPGTIADEISSAGTSPGFDGSDIISKDFVTTLTRGSSTVLKPIRQRFLQNGRQLTEYQIQIVFAENLKDGDILKLVLSDQIVSQEEDELVGVKSTEHHIFLQPSFSVSVLDATSLLLGDDSTQQHFTLRVTFTKPVVNAERELPDIYDFEIADVNNKVVDNAILSVSPVNTGRGCPQSITCHTDFNVVVSSSFLKGQRKFYFDVESGRLKSARDFLFVNGKQTLLDLNIAQPAIRLF
ncbi:uncharacterized protein LOC144434246 [Glandiceps talaboti]